MNWGGVEFETHPGQVIQSIVGFIHLNYREKKFGLEMKSFMYKIQQEPQIR